MDVHLGRSGLTVSRICLGTMNFGPHVTEEDAFRILDEALDAGIRLVDTADVYGKVSYEGVTEKILGRWFAQGGGRRERIVLATKVYGKMGPGPNDRGLSAYHIRRACEASLRRLNTDHIDLYQMHHVDPATPWEEIWQAMEQLIREGKISYVGSSNFAAWNIAQANCLASSRGLLGLVAEQSVYSLAQRSIELEVLPACHSLGLGMLAWSPLAGGLLAGMNEEGNGKRRHSDTLRQKFVEFEEKIEAYEDFCRQAGAPPAQVALAWLLHQPHVTAPIIGPRNLVQLKSALHAMQIHLSREMLAKLDEIWPGPGGRAPEAYAW